MDRAFSIVCPPIVCPHCNAEQYLASTEVSYGDGAVSELKCDNCGKPFICECSIKCFFKTSIQMEKFDDTGIKAQKSLLHPQR